MRYRERTIAYAMERGGIEPPTPEPESESNAAGPRREAGAREDMDLAGQLSNPPDQLRKLLEALV